MDAVDAGRPIRRDISQQVRFTGVPRNRRSDINGKCVSQLRLEASADFNRALGRIVLNMVNVDVELGGVDLEKEIGAAELEEDNVSPTLGPPVVPDISRMQRGYAPTDDNVTATLKVATTPVSKS